MENLLENIEKILFLLDILKYSCYGNNKEGGIYMEQNICRFIPKNGDSGELNIINLVYETNPAVYHEQKSISATHRLHIVVSGSGGLRTMGGIYPLSPGDIFFCLSSMPYTIRSEQDLTFYYLSFLGERANLLMDRTGIGRQKLYFPGFSYLLPIWSDTIQNPVSRSHLACEGLLLYTFAAIEGTEEKKEQPSDDLTLLLRKYIDDHFSDPTLSLHTLSREFSYSEKYISTLFKKNFKAGIMKYIQVLRIQRACELIEEGFTCVKDISGLCGFSDPLYFSKFFKERTGVPPKKYIQNRQSHAVD